MPDCNSRNLCFDSDCEICFDRSFSSCLCSKYWCYDKNNNVPRNIFSKSHKKFWLTCPICEHDVYISISCVTNHIPCKYCSGRNVCDDEDCEFCEDKREEKVIDDDHKYPSYESLYPKLITTIYGGTVRFIPLRTISTTKAVHPENYCVKFINPSKTKNFFSNTYGSKENAYENAINFRIQESNNRDLTKHIYTTDIELSQRQYFAGAIDGDGCICFTMKQITISYTCCQNNGTPKILKIFKKIYGGDIITQLRENKKHKNNCRWSICGKDALPILYDLKNYSIIKKEQASTVYNYLLTRINNSKENIKERKVIFDKLKYMKSPAYLSSIKVPDSNENLSDAYIAGFFDAEGCIMSSTRNPTSICVSLVQKYCTTIINAIHDKYHIPTRVKYEQAKTIARLSVSGEYCFLVMELIYPYSIIKKKQMELAIEMRQYCKPPAKNIKRTEHEIKKIKELHQELYTEKHL